MTPEILWEKSISTFPIRALFYVFFSQKRWKVQRHAFVDHTLGSEFYVKSFLQHFRTQNLQTDVFHRGPFSLSEMSKLNKMAFAWGTQILTKVRHSWKIWNSFRSSDSDSKRSTTRPVNSTSFQSCSNSNISRISRGLWKGSGTRLICIYFVQKKRGKLV